MKKFTLFVLMVCLTAVLIACGDTLTPTPTAGPTPTPQVVVVTVIPTVPPTAVPTEPPTAVPPVEVTWFVGPHLVECVGVAPQTCLQIRENPEDEYTLFYGTIEGFEFVEGSEYEIIVRIEPVANPPADGSAYTYTLVEVVDETPSMVAELAGTVSYLVPMALPDDAILSVQLQDTSLADAPAVVLGEDVYPTEGAQVPLPFSIVYNLSDIQPNHDYTLSARITDGQGKLLFINDTAIPVITNGNPGNDIEVMVVPVGGSSGETAVTGGLPEELLGLPWQWVAFTDPASGPQEIPNPENYRVQFEADGTVLIQADCNSGSGIYSVAGGPESGSMSIIPGPMTRAFCGDDSLDGRFLQYLEAAAIWFTQDGGLYFDLKFDSGTMQFAAETEATSGEDIAATAPESESSDTIPPDAIQIDLQGLADSYTWEARGSTPAAPGPGGAPGMPAHIILTFDGETADEALANNGRFLYIFPVQGYENLGGQSAAAQIERLQELVAEADGRTELPDDPMPLLPPPMSYMNRWAQFADLNFAGDAILGEGTGVRYVSEAPNRQSIGPWTNQGTAYYYQGLSVDGRFYLSLHWPVNTEALPNTFEETPEDVKAQSTDPEAYDTYLQTTKDTLNALEPTDWTPDLAKLDALVASITFE